MAEKNPHPPSYKPMLDEDGNPVVNRYGKVVSAKLTPEERARIDELIAAGSTIRAVAKELQSTERRVTDYLHRGKAAERIALLALTTHLVEDNRRQADQLQTLTETIIRMESRISDLQTMVRIVNENAKRQKIGRAKAEKEKRSQREELHRLRKQIWKRTGRKPLVRGSS